MAREAIERRLDRTIRRSTTDGVSLGSTHTTVASRDPESINFPFDEAWQSDLAGPAHLLAA